MKTIQKITPGRPLDLTRENPQIRILFFPETSEALICTNSVNAASKNRRFYNDRGEIITVAQAVAEHPELFTKSYRKRGRSRLPHSENLASFCLRIDKTLLDFCRRQGNASEYIRSLIQQEYDISVILQTPPQP